MSESSIDEDERPWPRLSPEAQERTLREFQRLQQINAEYLAAQETKTQVYSTNPEFAEKSFQEQGMEIVQGIIASLKDKLGEVQEVPIGPVQAREWNPGLDDPISVWRDPADGKTYVVNGHRRLQFARDKCLPDLEVKYIRALNAEEARAVGALENIAQGSGTAIDAAKFFRGSGYSLDRIREVMIDSKPDQQDELGEPPIASTKPSKDDQSLQEAREQNLQAGLDGLRKAATTVTAYN